MNPVERAVAIFEEEGIIRGRVDWLTPTHAHCAKIRRDYFLNMHSDESSLTLTLCWDDDLDGGEALLIEMAVALEATKHFRAGAQPIDYYSGPHRDARGKHHPPGADFPKRGNAYMGTLTLRVEEE